MKKLRDDGDVIINNYALQENMGGNKYELIFRKNSLLVI